MSFESAKPAALSPIASLDDERPTRVRHGVLAFVCVLAMITYLDRVCFGAAGPSLVADLKLGSEADLKWAFTAFVIAYALFEAPAGWMGDVFGPRGTLLRIVIWWSLFTALTGLVGLKIGGVVLGGWGTLVLIRFLFGAGEAGAYPNITRALHNWLPAQEWGKAQGLVWMSSRLMGGVTPLIWTLLVAGDGAPLNWRGAFLLFGFVGLAWCGAFALWFRNWPSEHPGVNDAERRLIGEHRDASVVQGPVPWRTMLGSLNLWALCVMYFFIAYGWYFNITYLPSFLENQYGVSPKSLSGAAYKGGPLWIGAAGCLLGGALADWLVRTTGNRRRGRRIIGATGQLLCAACWATAIYAPTALTFFLAVSSAAFFNDLTIASAWATCQDIGRRYAGVTAACMNTAGAVGAAIAGWLTGTLLERSLASHAAETARTVAEFSPAEKHAALLDGYHASFLTYASVYVLSALCWLVIDASKPLEQEAELASPE